MIGVEVTAMQTGMILSYQSAIFIEKNSDKNGQLSSSFLAANQHICATVNFCQVFPGAKVNSFRQGFSRPMSLQTCLCALYLLN